MILDAGTRCADDPTAVKSADLEVLLQDPDWVATQFAAIIEGAGWDDRAMAVGAAHAPDTGWRGRGGDGSRRRPAAASRRTRITERVRSPPLTPRTCTRGRPEPRWRAPGSAGLRPSARLVP